MGLGSLEIVKKSKADIFLNFCNTYKSKFFRNNKKDKWILLFWGWQPNFQKWLQNFEVAAGKFNLDRPLTSIASKMAHANILKIASNHSKSSKHWWEVWILGRGRKKTKRPINQFNPVHHSRQCALRAYFFICILWLQSPIHIVSFDWFRSGLEWIRVLLGKTFDILSEMIMEYQI